MFVYGLRLKTSVEYRYVGITSKSSARQRFVAHMSHSRGPKKQYPVNLWIQENGFEENVCMDILEEISPEDGLEFLEESEKMWIFALRFLGHELLNVSTGGRLPNGYKHSDEQKEAWSKQRKGSITGAKNPNWGKFGPDHPAHGRTPSESTRQRLREGKLGDKNPNYGRIVSQAERDNLSSKLKGRPRPSSKISGHTRHHTNKNISKPETCRYCKETNV